MYVLPEDDFTILREHDHNEDDFYDDKDCADCGAELDPNGFCLNESCPSFNDEDY